MKLKIVNSGTKEFPFYQLMDGENELCATDNLVNSEKIVKLCTLPHVSGSLPSWINKKGQEQQVFRGVVITKLQNGKYTWGFGETTLQKCKDEIEKKFGKKSPTPFVI